MSDDFTGIYYTAICYNSHMLYKYSQMTQILYQKNDDLTKNGEKGMRQNQNGVFHGRCKHIANVNMHI